VCRTQCIHTMEWLDMITESLARERARDYLQEAERMRDARRLRALRRARRLGHRAERRMVEAWRRAEGLRSTLESADY
jgi:hypothetical protein